MKQSNTPDMSLEWDDTIENDGAKFIVLEEGDYNFTVTKFERGRFPGSAKIPPCNMAILTLTIETENGTAICRTDLILYRTLEWRLSSFFRSIGQKKQGEEFRMDWSKVLNARGRAHIRPHTFEGKDGTKKQINEVAYFLDWDDRLMDVNDDEELPIS